MMIIYTKFPRTMYSNPDSFSKAKQENMLPEIFAVDTFPVNSLMLPSLQASICFQQQKMFHASWLKHSCMSLAKLGNIGEMCLQQMFLATFFFCFLVSPGWC